MKFIMEIEFVPMNEDYDDTEEWVFTEEEFYKNISKFTRVQQVAFYNYVTESKKCCDEIDNIRLINFFKSYNHYRKLFTDCFMNFDVVEDTEKYTFYRI